MEVFGDVEVLGGGASDNNGIQITFSPAIVTSVENLRYICRNMSIGNVGLIAGGYNGSSLNTMDYVQLISKCNALDFGDLDQSRYGLAGTSNPVRTIGVFSAGHNGSIFLSTKSQRNLQLVGNAGFFGNLIYECRYRSGVSNAENDRSVIIGGENSNTYYTNMEYFQTSTDSDALDFGNLPFTARLNDSTSNGLNNTAILSSFSQANSPALKEIQYFNISTLGNSQYFGDMISISSTWAAMTSNHSRNKVLISGSYYQDVNLNTFTLDNIERLSVTTLDSCEEFGSLTVTRGGANSLSDGTPGLGLVCGGLSSTSTYYNIIDYCDIETPGNALDFGNLSQSRCHAAAISNGGTSNILYHTDEVSDIDSGDLFIFTPICQLKIFDTKPNSEMTSGVDNNVYDYYKQYTTFELISDGNKALFFCGTAPGGICNYIDTIDLSVCRDAELFPTVGIKRNYPASTSNGANSRAVIGGGWNNISISGIDHLNFFTKDTIEGFGNLTEARYGLTSTSNGRDNRGVFAGGWTAKNTIDYITISTPSNALSFGELSVGRGGPAGTSNGYHNRGIFFGGYPGYDTIDYIAIYNDSDAINFGDLAFAKYGCAATSNTLFHRAVIAGGYRSPSPIEVIEYVGILSSGDSLEFGNMIQTRYQHAATSNGVGNRGLFAGGNIGGPMTKNVDYISINVTADALLFGTLFHERYQLSAASNCD